MTYTKIKKLANEINNKITQRFSDTIDWKALDSQYTVLFDPIFDGLNEAAYFLDSERHSVVIDHRELKASITEKLDPALDAINSVILFLYEMKNNPMLQLISDNIVFRIKRLNVLAEAIKVAQEAKNGIKYNLQLISRIYEAINKVTSILDFKSSLG